MPETRTGFGIDVHALKHHEAYTEAQDRYMTLCGFRIPSTLMLVGHSDADAGLHALTDAILGTIAAGDIGDHFPPSDPRWKGADSRLFVAHALKLLEAKGGKLIHADLTFIAQRPKLAPYRAAMRETLAKILGLTQDRVSIKATTTEGLGFTGRAEGLACQAVVTVEL